MIGPILLTLGMHYTVPAEAHLQSEAGYNFTIGTEAVQLYLDYEPDKRHVWLGQPVGDTTTIDYGVQGRFPLTEKFILTASFGKLDIDLDANDIVVHEIVPVQIANDFRELRGPAKVISYELDAGYSISVGAEYEFVEHLYVYGKYVWSHVQQEMLLTTGGSCGPIPVPADCVDHLEKNTELNWGWFQLGFKYAF